MIRLPSNSVAVLGARTRLIVNLIGYNRSLILWVSFFTKDAQCFVTASQRNGTAAQHTYYDSSFHLHLHIDKNILWMWTRNKNEWMLTRKPRYGQKRRTEYIALIWVLAPGWRFPNLPFARYRWRNNFGILTRCSCYVHRQRTTINFNLSAGWRQSYEPFSRWRCNKKKEEGLLLCLVSRTSSVWPKWTRLCISVFTFFVDVQNLNIRLTLQQPNTSKYILFSNQILLV